MKKCLKTAVFLCLCLILAGAGLGAADARAANEAARGSISANNIQWVLWDDGELVFYVWGTGSASIPSMDANSTSQWLAYKSQIKTVTIHAYENDNITSIGRNAFSGCTNLTSVDIPENTVTALDSYIFDGCTKLTSLTLPSTITSVSNSAFSGAAASLKLRVASPTSATAKALTSAGYAFYKGSDNAFALQCSGTGVVTLKQYTGTAASVTVPSHVHLIGAEAFKNDTTLTSVTIPSSVTGMGNGVFSGCTNLTAVTLNEGLTGISYDAFASCASLNSINIPNSVTLIDGYAFFGCTGLTSLTLTDSVASVANTAFSGASNLHVYVPTPKGTAAQAVSSASDYYVTGDNTFALRYANSRYELRKYTGTAASVTVPSHVDYIAEEAFKNDTALTSVTIPSSVTGMGSGVFSGCENLTTVTLNEGLTAISYDAFASCASLNSINIPNSVTLIDGYAFYNCTGLTSLTLTDNVASVANTAFSGASNLRVYVPTPKGTAAQAVSNASDYYVTGDNTFALRYANSRYELRKYTGTAVSVTVPSHVDYIAAEAFKNDTALTSVIIPSSVTGMGSGVFSGCENLTAVTLNEGLTAISYDAFSSCASLNSINIPDSVTLIDGYAFFGCTGLTSLTLTDSVASVANTAFSGMNDLRLYAGCGSYAAGWAANYNYTEVKEDDPTGGKQLVLLHDWSVAYDWNGDHSTVTATRTCARDTEQTHVETETVSATSAVTTPATCTAKGKTTYTSLAFENPAFTAQTVTLTDVPALGHLWNAPSYAWNDTNTQVTATRTCQRADHPETETVGVTSAITTPATCTAKGKTTYTSNPFDNTAFAVQSKTLTDVPALGHVSVTDAAVEPTCTETGLTQGAHCSRCGAVLTAQNVVPALGHARVTDAAVEPTCTLSGLTQGAHCSRCGAVLTAQYVVPALGHVSVTDAAVEPTCTLSGLTQGVHCERCGIVMTAQNVVPARGHAFVVAASTAATETADGVRGGTLCSVCGMIRTASRTVSRQKILKIPALMNTIEEEAFWGVAAEQVVIPAGTTAIGREAFANCSHLLLVVIPSSVTSFGEDIFLNSDVAVICPDNSPAAAWCDLHQIPHNP